VVGFRSRGRKARGADDDVELATERAGSVGEDGSSMADCLAGQTRRTLRRDNNLVKIAKDLEIRDCSRGF